jgi:SnoaL-like domain
MTEFDAVARFCTASAANDLDGMVSTLTLDAELVSPISGRMVFRGRDDLRVLITAVYGATIRNLRWHDRVGTGDLQVAFGNAKIGPLTLTDATIFELAEDGLIRRMRPHLRP